MNYRLLVYLALLIGPSLVLGLEIQLEEQTTRLFSIGSAMWAVGVGGSLAIVTKDQKE